MRRLITRRREAISGIMRHGAGIATKKFFLRPVCAGLLVCLLRLCQYGLSFFQILLRIYVEEEILRAGQIAKFDELDMACADTRQQRPGSVFSSGNKLFNCR